MKNKDVFNSPEFKEFSDMLDKSMKACDKAPSMECPVCGNRMGMVMGLGTFDGYQCHGLDCVGIRLTHEDLIDAERFKYVCEEAKARHDAREEMRKRNGFIKGSYQVEIETISAPFECEYRISKDDLRKALCAGDSKWQKLWKAHYTAHIPAWCGTCRGYHLPTKEHPLHTLCGGIHAPMPKDIFFDYRGWKFSPPFICMGCGIEICFRQWAFSRSCGPCDVSNSKTRRLLYHKCFAGPHIKLPTWSEEENDIQESHFVNPSTRLDYPVLPEYKFAIPQRDGKRRKK